jgi:hypothetical protein
LVELVRASWAEGDVGYHDQVGVAAAAIAGDPFGTLDRFDRYASYRGPGLLILAIRAFERYRAAHGPGDSPPFPPDLIRGLARELSNRRQYMSYSVARSRLLGILTSERIHPLEFAEACDTDPDPWYRGLSDPVRGDISFRLAWVATRLHRG